MTERRERRIMQIMNAANLIEIPDDLAAEAAKMPGLPERLVSFLRAEVSLHRRRKNHHSDQVRGIVQRAQEEAEKLKTAGMTPEEAKAEFADLYAGIADQLQAKS